MFPYRGQGAAGLLDVEDPIIQGVEQSISGDGSLAAALAAVEDSAVPAAGQNHGMDESASPGGKKMPSPSALHRRKLSDGLADLQNLESVMRSPSMKDQDMEVQRLQKVNFNMKLRIFYLEERLAQRHTGETSEDAAAMEEQLFQLKMLNEERTRELEDRNLLLIKSRNAIETLQGDLELARASARDMQASKVSAAQLESKEKLAALQEEKILALEADLQKQAAMTAEIVRKNEMMRKELTDSHDAHRTATTQVKALQLELESRSREIEKLTVELDVLRPMMSVQDALKSALEGKEGELDALSTQLDESRVAQAELEAKLAAARVSEEAAKKAAEDVSRLEVSEVARMEAELARVVAEKDREADDSLRMKLELEEQRSSLAETTQALEMLERRNAATEAELTVVKESRRARDEQLQTTAAQNEADMLRKHTEEVGNLRQQLVEQSNRLAEAEFARKEAQRRLVAESEELGRTRKLCSEMQRRVLEADEARRQDDHAKTMAIERAQRGRETMENELKKERAELEALRSMLQSETQDLRSTARERESRLRKHMGLWVRLVDAALSECLEPSRSSASAQHGSAGGFPGDAFRRALADLNESSSDELLRDVDAVFPKRALLDKLDKVRQIRHAFTEVVASAEKKYVGQMEELRKRVDKKALSVDSLMERQSRLLGSVSSTLELRRSTMDMRQRVEALDDEKTRLVSQVDQLHDQLHTSRLKSAEDVEMHNVEVSRLKDMNQQLEIANIELNERLGAVTVEVEELREAHTRLGHQMRLRESQIKEYTDDLRRETRIATRRGNSRDQELTDVSKDRLTMRESIARQVKNTRESIRDAVGSLETERDRYRSSKGTLTASDLNISRDKTAAGVVPKVTIHRTGSVDIGLSTRQSAARQSYAGVLDASAVMDRRRVQPTVDTSTLRAIDDLKHLAANLDTKDTGLRNLLREIQDLVRSTKDHLDRYFSLKTKSQQAAPGSRSRGGVYPGPRDESLSVLQRDVMTLLDNNARLALQLQALGQDLQKVYRRFKSLETQMTSPLVSGRERMPGTDKRGDVSREQVEFTANLIANMQKWGHDLQSAASKLAETGSRVER